MLDTLLKDWGSFEAVVSQLLNGFEKRRTQQTGYVSEPLFRGQAVAAWPLRTSLERFSQKTWSVREYFSVVRAVAPEIRSRTSKPWPLPDEDEIDEGNVGPPPGYELMIYLRHHDFPSPLLDWSRSPYVAAFFAFQS